MGITQMGDAPRQKRVRFCRTAVVGKRAELRVNANQIEALRTKRIEDVRAEDGCVVGYDRIADAGRNIADGV